MDYVVGLLFLVPGLFGLGRSLRLRMKGLFTFGTVTVVNGMGRSRHLSISFESLNKKTFVVTNGFLPSFILYQVGDSVPVLYDPSNPAMAVIANFDTMWLLPLILVGCGILPVLIY
jgi:hypothetical protein